MKIKCSVCGRKVVLGVEATVDENDHIVCDNCSGVIRDIDGYAWFPNQKTMVLCDPNTKDVVETRTRPARK